MKRCEICGASFEDVPLAGRLVAKGFGLFAIKTCPICGLTFCSNCGVAKKKPSIFATTSTLVKLAECPRCNPNGWRGDR